MELFYISNAFKCASIKKISWCVLTYCSLSVCVGQNPVDLHFVLVHLVDIYPQVLARRIWWAVCFWCIVVVVCVLLKSEKNKQNASFELERLWRGMQTKLKEGADIAELICELHWLSLCPHYTVQRVANINTFKNRHPAAQCSFRLPNAQLPLNKDKMHAYGNSMAFIIF